jgi:outer membrane autotransporter protein
VKRSFKKCVVCLVLRALPILSSFLFASAPKAQTVWIDGSGDWFLPRNWSAGVPDFFNTAYINNGGTAVIARPGVTRAHNTILGFNTTDSGTLIIDHQSFLATNNVAAGYLGTGTFKLMNDSSLLDVNGFVGDFAGSNGSASVDGHGSTWTNLQTLVIGQLGRGVLRITNGGTVTSPQVFIGQGPLIGHSNDAVGAVSVSGTGSILSSATIFNVGGHGIGTLLITDGGVVSNGESGGVANGSSAIVTGPGSIWKNNTQGFTSTDQFADSGTLKISNGGTVSDTRGAVGTDGAGAPAVVTVDGLGSSWRNEVDLSIGGLNGGTLQITNGAAVFSGANGGIAAGVGSSGIVRVDGTGSRWVHNGFLAVGANGGAAILDLRNGGRVSCVDATVGSANPATNQNEPSMVRVDGSGSTWSVGGKLTLAQFSGGIGTLDVSNGGSVASATAIVGSAFRGRGTVNVDGLGSTWICPGQLDVGQLGDGFLNVTGGGKVFSGDSVLGLGIPGAFGIPGVSPSLGGGLISGVGSAWVVNGSLSVGGKSSGSAGFGLLQISNEGSLSIARNYQQTTGMLQIGIASLNTPEGGLISAGGSAWLDGTLQVTSLNSLHPHPGILTLLTAEGGVHGRFAAVEANFSERLFKVVYRPNDVLLQFSFLGLPSLTPNQAMVAKALDELATDTRSAVLIDRLGSEPLASFPGDYDLIAPEELASIYEIGFSQATVQSLNLQRRMEDIRAGSTGFSASGYQMRNAHGFNTGDDGKTVLDKNPSTPFVPSPENRWGVFVTGTGQFVSVGNDDFNARGYDITTGGITVGLDYRLTNNFAIGLSGTYAHDDADLVDAGNVDADGGKLGLYATYFSDGFYVDLFAGGGWNNYEARRTALLGSAHSNTGGAEFNGLIGAGYDWKCGNLHFGPTANLQYSYLAVDGFSESGSLAPLHFPNQSEYSVRSSVGARLSSDWKLAGVILRPELRVAWQHEYNDRAYPVDSRFASGAGGVFTVHGPNIGRDSALVSAGAALLWNDRVSTYLGYDGEFGRSNYTAHNVNGGISINF